MVIRISDIPEKGLRVRIDDRRKELDYAGLKLPIVKPFSGFLYVKKLTGARVLVEGTVEVILRLTCSRCLETFDFEVMQSFRDEYYPVGIIKYSEKELSRTELDILFYKGNEIDLTVSYLEKVYLALPMKPLCKPDCKGICPVCGKNLNYGECTCKKKEVDPRLKALEEIKEKLLKG